MSEKLPSEQMNGTPDKYWVVCIYLVLVLTTLAVFWQVRHHEFINFDDDLYILNNDHVKTGLTLKGLVWAFTSAHAYNWHPITWISHMLDCEFYGTDPAGHHFTNVLFHIANTLLLLLVLHRLTGSFWPSAFVAAAFALHPLHVESVAWASERKDVLSTFFWLLTMWFYTRHVRQPKIGRYLAVILVFALGLMAKQMLVTLPFVLLLLDYWPLNRFRPKVIIEKLPLLFLSLVAAVVVYLVQGHTGAVKSLPTLPPVYRAENALVAYVAYIGKMFWPRHLAIFYPHQGDTLSVWRAGLSALLLVLITVAVFWKAKRYPYLVVGWLWYLGTLVPVIGLVQVGLQAWADRYTYVPLTGLFIMIAWGIPDFLARWQYRKVVLSLSGAMVLLALGLTSWFQAGYWQNDMTLYEHAALVVPNNWWAHNNLGVAFSSRGKLDEAISHYRQAIQLRVRFPEAQYNLSDRFSSLSPQDMLDDAVDRFRQAIQLDPCDAESHYNLANALQLQGKLDEATSLYRQVLRIKPNLAEAHNSLGIVLATQGKLDEAISHYRQALQLKPDLPEVHYNLGLAFKLQGKIDEAISNYRQELQLMPYSVKAHYNLAIVLQSRGMLDEAISHYRQAIQLKPGFAEAHYNLAGMLQSQGKLGEAISHYRQALQIQPDYADAYNNLGYTLGLQGKFDEAVSCLNEALRLNPSHCEAHNNLALAFQLQGNFDEALRHYRQALQSKPDWVSPLNGMAWILATHPNPKMRDGPQAVALAERAAELTKHQDANILKTLAAAYAAAGQRERAITTLQTALKLASAAGDDELANHIRSQLESYKQVKP